jgi:hypothetical protein
VHQEDERQRRCNKRQCYNPFQMPRQGEARRGKGSTVAGVPLQQQPATCWESLSSKGDVIVKRRRQRQGGGAKEMTPGIQCWPQPQLVLQY